MNIYIKVRKNSNKMWRKRKRMDEEEYYFNVQCQANLRQWKRWIYSKGVANKRKIEMISLLLLFVSILKTKRMEHERLVNGKKGSNPLKGKSCSWFITLFEPTSFHTLTHTITMDTVTLPLSQFEDPNRTVIQKLKKRKHRQILDIESLHIIIEEREKFKSFYNL